MNMRFFRDLDGVLGAPIHDTDGWGSFPGPSLDDEAEDEARIELEDLKLNDFFIPDLIVPAPTPQPTLAQAAIDMLPPYDEIVRANRASFVMMPKVLVAQLRNEIERMLFTYDYKRDRSDYVCRFCDERPQTNYGEIKHDSECLGIKLKTFFEGQEEGE